MMTDLQMQYLRGQVIDREATIERQAAELERLKDAAETWHGRYQDACQKHNDKMANKGAEIEAIEEQLTRQAALIKHCEMTLLAMYPRNELEREIRNSAIAAIEQFERGES